MSVRFVVAFGEQGDRPGQFRQPQGISCDNNGYVYVADTGNHRIQKFDPQGRFVAMIGGFGWSDEQFQRPLDVSTETGLDIFVADHDNRRIVRLDKELHWIASYRSSDVEERLLLGFPSSIGVSIHDDLFVVDDENKRILKLNPQRLAELSFGNYDWGTGALSDPSGIAVSRDDRVYVTDRSAGRIQVYDNYGTFLFYLGENICKSPSGICVDSRGFIWVTDIVLQQVLVFDCSGRQQKTFGGPGVKYGAMQNPTDAAIFQNRLYVADTNNHRIQLFEISLIKIP